MKEHKEDKKTEKKSKIHFYSADEKKIILAITTSFAISH